MSLEETMEETMEETVAWSQCKPEPFVPIEDAKIPNVKFFDHDGFFSTPPVKKSKKMRNVYLQNVDKTVEVLLSSTGSDESEYEARLKREVQIAKEKIKQKKRQKKRKEKQREMLKRDGVAYYPLYSKAVKETGKEKNIKAIPNDKTDFFDF